VSRNLPLCLVLLALAACAQISPEQKLIRQAATALGGADKVTAVKTLTQVGTGVQYNLGQELTPEAHSQIYTVSAYRRDLDATATRARTELTRKPEFVHFQGPAPQTQITGIDGDVAYNVGGNGRAARAPQAAATERRDELLQHPLTAVRAALDPAAKLSNLRTDGGQSLLDVTTADGRQFTLAADSATHLPSRVSARGDNPNLGDVVNSTVFADYRDVAGLKLPTRLTTSIDHFVTQELTLTAQQLDGNVDVAAPAGAAQAAAPAPQAPAVTVQALAQGVWWLAGGSHHSVLVEFSDHLMLIEAPLSEARALAVIAKARQLVPGKPLTQLVSTHYHFDHSAGVRAAISEGLEVITLQSNVAFLQQAAQRPHTLAPDALARSASKVRIEGFERERTISDGVMTVTLFAEPSTHSQTMLVAWLPKQKLLVEADLYTPGIAINVYAKPFLDDLQTRKLQIDRIAPLHGTIVPFAQLVKDAAPPGPGG
jgi:glyoxylase-like metal-dependent hydrolase (beta-lactamase superfamily II)